MMYWYNFTLGSYHKIVREINKIFYKFDKSRYFANKFTFYSSICINHSKVLEYFLFSICNRYLLWIIKFLNCTCILSFNAFFNYYFLIFNFKINVSFSIVKYIYYIHAINTYKMFNISVKDCSALCREYAQHNRTMYSGI